MNKKEQGKRNREWGAQAEMIAREWFVTHGYVLREKNWRIGNSIEVDIILELPGIMVFVEVKARTGKDVDAIDAIDEKKIRKMVRAANVYLQKQDKLFQYRFDIFTVTGSPDDYTVNHYPDAFYPPLGCR